MRLTDYEIISIKEISEQVFGKNRVIQLFGSRVYDNKRGGDIDLFIECDKKYNELKNIRNFSVMLQDKIGEQKIDIIVKSFDEDDDRAVVHEALTKGILL